MTPDLLPADPAALRLIGRLTARGISVKAKAGDRLQFIGVREDLWKCIQAR